MSSAETTPAALLSEEFHRAVSSDSVFPTTFFGIWSLPAGMYTIGTCDVLLGIVQAFAYFGPPQPPLTCAGCVRIVSGLLCFIGLLFNSTPCLNIYLLTVLFNLCMLLAVSLGFIIMLTADHMIDCKIELPPDVPAHMCPWLERQGAVEAMLTMVEFVLYCYFTVVVVAFFREPYPKAESSSFESAAIMYGEPSPQRSPRRSPRRS